MPPKQTPFLQVCRFRPVWRAVPATRAALRFLLMSMPLAPAAASDWSIVNSPNAPAPTSNTPLGVTCVSASDCWAVGYYYNGSYAQTLIERWDGTSWAIVSSPNTSPTQANFLYGVTCVSASDCWAVGYYNGRQRPIRP